METLDRARRSIILRVSLATLLSMSLWFSATAVAPTLQVTWNLSSSETAWLTMAVQLGFVVGTLVSTLFTLADRIEARLLFAYCSFAGAVVNGMMAWADGLTVALPLRFATGALLAGVYPPGMKLAASWTKEDRGLAVGALVGALTVGTAAPHFFGILTANETVDTLPWRTTVLAASTLAALGGLLVLIGVAEGPYAGRVPRFRAGAIREILKQPGVKMANVGYLGHMWELYAMWAWVPIYLLELFQKDYGPRGIPLAAAASFAVIAVGGPGSLVAGYLADRFGRTAIVIVSLSVSGACCLIVGVTGEISAVAVFAVCLIWGFAVVADSAQFSTMVTELAPPRLMGTALTLQTSMGFLLTMVSLQAVPLVRQVGGWPLAFGMLAIGPAAGIAAMVHLRRLPEAQAIASGKM